MVILAVNGGGDGDTDGAVGLVSQGQSGSGGGGDGSGREESRDGGMRGKRRGGRAVLDGAIRFQPHHVGAMSSFFHPHPPGKA